MKTNYFANDLSDIGSQQYRLGSTTYVYEMKLREVYIKDKGDERFYRML
jgi:hypothetical protein